MNYLVGAFAYFMKIGDNFHLLWIFPCTQQYRSQSCRTLAVLISYYQYYQINYAITLDQVMRQADENHSHSQFCSSAFTAICI